VDMMLNREKDMDNKPLIYMPEGLASAIGRHILR
jgi:hypothetical protein